MIVGAGVTVTVVLEVIVPGARVVNWTTVDVGVGIERQEHSVEMTEGAWGFRQAGVETDRAARACTSRSFLLAAGITVYAER